MEPALRLIEMGNVFAHLVLPVWPIVSAFRAPIVEGMANSLVGENSGEMVSRAGIFPGASARGEMNIAGSELVVNPGVGKILDVIGWIVEIEIVVVHAVHEVAQVINTGHGEAALDDVRMFEKRIRGVICTERCAHRGDGNLRLAIAPDERNHLFAQIGIENGLNVAAMEGMRALVVKAVAVDGIDGIELDAARVNKIGERADHSLAFEFPFVAGTGGKTENRRTPMAVHDDAEFDSKAMRIPTVIVTLHERAFRMRAS